MASTFVKDPDAVLDYTFDWSDWLEDDEMISSYIIRPHGGIVVDSYSESSGLITVWLSGGRPKSTCSIVCRIVSSDGRTDDRTMQIKVRER